MSSNPVTTLAETNPRKLSYPDTRAGHGDVCQPFFSSSSSLLRLLPGDQRKGSSTPPDYSEVTPYSPDLNGKGITEVDIDNFLTHFFPSLYSTFLQKSISHAETLFGKSSPQSLRINPRVITAPRWPKKGWQNLHKEALEIEVDDEKNGKALHELWTKRVFPIRGIMERHLERWGSGRLWWSIMVTILNGDIANQDFGGSRKQIGGTDVPGFLRG